MMMRTNYYFLRKPNEGFRLPFWKISDAPSRNLATGYEGCVARESKKRASIHPWRTGRIANVAEIAQCVGEVANGRVK